MRGVPRDRREISQAPSASISIPSTWAAPVRNPDQVLHPVKIHPAASGRSGPAGPG